MGNVAANVAKGVHGYYATLPATNDALIAVPVEASGLEADSVLIDYDDLAAMLAAANNEQTSNMTRKTLSAVTSTVDDTANKRVVDADNITFTGATGNGVGKLFVGYDPDTTGGTDSSIVPMYYYDFVATPAGGDITFAFNAGGLAESA